MAPSPFRRDKNHGKWDCNQQYSYNQMQRKHFWFKTAIQSKSLIETCLSIFRFCFSFFEWKGNNFDTSQYLFIFTSKTTIHSCLLIYMNIYTYIQICITHLILRTIITASTRLFQTCTKGSM